MIKKLLHLSLILSLVACEEQQAPQTTPQPEIEFTAVSFDALPNWKNDNLALAIAPFNDSCLRILNENTEYLSNSKAKISTSVYQTICRDFINLQPQNTEEFRNFIQEHFTPYQVSCQGSAEGKFTSYYESSLNASLTKHGPYQHPVYGKPFDLIEFNPHDFDASAPSKRYVGRVENQKLVPYYTRQQIDSQPINAPVILWADSKIDINIMQIQGSAVATLDDGRKVRVGYADNNGHPFKGIGSILLSKGLLKPGEASMSHIKKWLQNNPDKADEIYHENDRFIFHRLLNTEGPLGAHGVPLHAGRSLAVDRSYIPLGSLLWLDTTGPDKEPLQKLVVAQDIGSAIKGCVRGDYFWGSGADEVLEKAGKMNSKGRYYIFLPHTSLETTNDSQNNSDQ